MGYVTAYELITLMLLPVCAYFSYSYGFESGIEQTIASLHEQGLINLDEEE